MEGMDMAITSWKRALEEASALQGRLGLNGSVPEEYRIVPDRYTDGNVPKADTCLAVGKSP